MRERVALLLLVALTLVSGSRMVHAESIAERTAKDPCPDRLTFEQDGWEHEDVQKAMDSYMQEHRMRANWLNQPAPPDQIGRDYYYWLWHNSFGAKMKARLTRQFCGGSARWDDDYYETYDY